MRIFNWVQSKITGRNECKRPEVKLAGTHQYQAPNHKEEFSDWPNGLLAIGTFGNGDQKCKNNEIFVPEKPSLSQEFPGFTVEEVSKLQKELTRLMSLKTQSDNSGSEVEEKTLPLDKFLSCPSSLENAEDSDVSPSTRMMLSRAKDGLAGNRGDLKQRSLSFLLKKMFVCSGGFPPMPSLRDPVPESRIEKVLRALLQKKIHPHGSAPPTAKKYLEKNPPNENDDPEKTRRYMNSGSKWVKTDSEYIVLEI